jgi:hypothetical protein
LFVTIAGAGTFMAKKNKKAADEALLTALAFGATVENAARRAGIGERTAYRRLAHPAFQARLNQVRVDMVVRTAGMLTGAGIGSVKTLVDLQQEAATPAAVRRGAARDVLELGIKFRDSAELEQRVAALENRMATGR